MDYLNYDGGGWFGTGVIFWFVNDTFSPCNMLCVNSLNVREFFFGDRWSCANILAEYLYKIPLRHQKSNGPPFTTMILPSSMTIAPKSIAVNQEIVNWGNLKKHFAFNRLVVSIFQFRGASLPNGLRCFQLRYRTDAISQTPIKLEDLSDWSSYSSVFSHYQSILAKGAAPHSLTTYTGKWKPFQDFSSFSICLFYCLD